MARPLKPLVKSGGYYPSRKWTPLVYRGGYTTANGGGEQPDPVEKTVSGAIVHITDALAAPVSALSVAIEPVQDLHGYDAPWPAGGRGNICDPSTLRNGYYDASGAFVGDTTHKTSALIPVKANTKYTGTIFDGSGTRLNDLVYTEWNASEEFIQQSIASDFITTANTAFVRVRNRDAQSSYITSNNFLYQFQEGSATAFAPYSNICPISGWTGANIHVSPTTDAQDGTTYSITFPSAAGTVYGGTLDVTTGKLTVDMAMADMGTLTWTGWEQGGSIIFYSHVLGKMPVREIPCISSQYAYSSTITGSWDDLLNGELTGQFGGDIVYVRDNRYSSIADFKTAMSGVQLVYPLDTPIEYTLTPTEVTTLLGENNIWADAGDVTVTYIADGNASDAEALGILLGGRYTPSDDVTDKEALDIILGGTE